MKTRAVVLILLEISLSLAISSIFVGTNYSDWNNPSNWNPSVVPSNSSYTVTIPSNTGTLILPSLLNVATLSASSGTTLLIPGDCILNSIISLSPTTRLEAHGHVTGTGQLRSGLIVLPMAAQMDINVYNPTTLQLAGGFAKSVTCDAACSISGGTFGGKGDIGTLLLNNNLNGLANASLTVVDLEWNNGQISIDVMVVGTLVLSSSTHVAAGKFYVKSSLWHRWYGGSLKANSDVLLTGNFNCTSISSCIFAAGLGSVRSRARWVGPVNFGAASVYLEEGSSFDSLITSSYYVQIDGIVTIPSLTSTAKLVVNGPAVYIGDLTLTGVMNISSQVFITNFSFSGVTSIYGSGTIVVRDNLIQSGYIYLYDVTLILASSCISAVTKNPWHLSGASVWNWGDMTCVGSKAMQHYISENSVWVNYGTLTLSGVGNEQNLIGYDNEGGGGLWINSGVINTFTKNIIAFQSNVTFHQCPSGRINLYPLSYVLHLKPTSVLNGILNFMFTSEAVYNSIGRNGFPFGFWPNGSLYGVETTETMINGTVYDDYGILCQKVGVDGLGRISYYNQSHVPADCEFINSQHVPDIPYCQTAQCSKGTQLGICLSDTRRPIIVDDDRYTFLDISNSDVQIIGDLNLSSMSFNSSSVSIDGSLSMSNGILVSSTGNLTTKGMKFVDGEIHTDVESKLIVLEHLELSESTFFVDLKNQQPGDYNLISYSTSNINPSSIFLKTENSPSTLCSTLHIRYYAVALEVYGCNSISTGAVIGIVVGVFVFVLLVGAYILFYYYPKNEADILKLRVTSFVTGEPTN